MIDRRTMIGLLAAAIPAVACAKPARAAELKIYKSPYCGCCGAWVEHVRASGLKGVVQEMEDVTPVARKAGVPDAVRSCHTSEIGGYAIEGHVPAADVKRLLATKPKAAGIAVPGMVMGSPGMEHGDHKESYQVLLFDKTGKTKVFASY